jgi:hypothetical protein
MHNGGAMHRAAHRSPVNMVGPVVAVSLAKPAKPAHEE